MLKIGLTGGIGSGKTTVANIFKVLGIPVFDADSVTRNLMNSDEALIASIKKTFGEEAYINGLLNRKYLGDIVFNDSYKLELLNALTHPAAINAAAQWMAAQNAPYTIKEAALMFESASAAGVDLIIGVSAPQHVRIKRVMHRDGISREAVMARIDKQLNESIKMKLCDFVIVNDERQLLIPQVIQLHQQFLQQRL